MNWIIILTIAISFGVTATSFASKYELLIDDSSPGTGIIRLILQEPLKSDTPLVTRKLDTSDIREPICATSGQALTFENEEWFAPEGCAEIVWSVNFTTPVTVDQDVSEQVNLYHTGRWWLFSEWGNLLRLGSNASETEICTRGPIEMCRRIPSSQEAPLLLLIGVPDNQIIVGETSFNFFTGNLPSDFDVAYLYRSYDQQLSYLYSLMTQISSSPPPEAIDVLILGINSSLGLIGGAAGQGAYLANISVSETGMTTPQQKIKHLWVAAHEMAHLLGLGTDTLWASESLAHYYGFKSLGGGEHASQLFEQMVSEMSEIGLLKAYQLVLDGEWQHYAQFYVKGAAFWRDVDHALIEATQGKQSLDDYLVLLINGQFGVNGELPDEFVNVMVEVLGQEKIERLHHAYL